MGFYFDCWSLHFQQKHELSRGSRGDRGKRTLWLCASGACGVSTLRAGNALNKSKFARMRSTDALFGRQHLDAEPTITTHPRAGCKDVVRALAHVDERGIYLSASQDKCLRAWLAPSRKAAAAAAQPEEGRKRADTLFVIEVRLGDCVLTACLFSQTMLRSDVQNLKQRP